MAKYFALIICFLLPALLVAEEVQIEVGNIEATLDVIQGNPQTTLEIIYNANDTEVEVLQGDTIKITQGAQEVIVEVVSGDRDALADAIEQKPDVHYFIKTADEGIAILEIWGKPNFDELEREGYQKTTKEDIHNQGYLTPSESEEKARQDGYIDESTDRIYGYSSWINAWTSGNTKYIEGGSQTTRPWYAPGTLWLTCSLYVQNITPQGPPGLSGAYPPYSTWGYRTYYTFPRSYASSITRYWKQRGRHHWGNPNNMRASEATRIY